MRLVNEELDASHSIYRERLEVIDAELNDARTRLSRLYDALETGKLNLDDLAPRIKELKARIDDLSKTRLLVEADLTVQGVRHVDKDMVVAYASDLRSLLGESDIAESKSFLRTFVKRIVVQAAQAVIYYSLPVPPQGRTSDTISVLPMVTPSGAGGIRTPYLLTARQTAKNYQHTSQNETNKRGA